MAFLSVGKGNCGFAHSNIGYPTRFYYVSFVDFEHVNVR